jgi:hypothetical protein
MEAAQWRRVFLYRCLYEPKLRAFARRYVIVPLRDRLNNQAGKKESQSSRRVMSGQRELKLEK